MTANAAHSSFDTSMHACSKWRTDTAEPETKTVVSVLHRLTAAVYKYCNLFFCGLKKKANRRLTCPIPSQSARSRALARAVERPTTRTPLEVWEEMKLVLDTMTSNTGPLSSPGTQSSTTNVHKDVDFHSLKWKWWPLFFLQDTMQFMKSNHFIDSAS